MSARSTQEEVLPEVGERQKLLAQAAVVLAEARSLLDCLDQSGGKMITRARASSARTDRVLMNASRAEQVDRFRWSIS